MNDDRLRQQAMAGGQRSVGTSDFFFGACLTYIEEQGLDATAIEAWEGATFAAMDPWLRLANELPEGREIDLAWLEALAKVCAEEDIYARFLAGVRAQQG